MNLKHLRSFIAVAHSGSVSKASEQLHIAQPALSAKLAALEAELGIKLFIRSHRGVTLTPEGEFLLEHGTRLLQDIHKVTAELKKGDTTVGGRVRLGLPGTASEVIGAAIVRRVIKKYPGIQVCVTEGSVRQLREMVDHGRLDLAILLNESVSVGLDITPVAVESYCVLGPPGQAGMLPTITWPELAKLPLLLPNPESLVRQWVDAAAAAHGIRLHPVVEMDSTHLLKNGVREGLGYAILPESAARLHAEERLFSVRRIVSPELRALLALASSSVRPASRAQDVVRTVVVELCREMILDGRWKAESPESAWPPTREA